VAARAADLARIDGRLRRAAHLLAIAGVVVLLLQAASIVADAMARWLLNTPIPGTEDLNIVVIGVTVASFMPALFIERANITVNLLGHAMGARTSARLDAFGHVLALVFIALLTWQYFEYARALGPTHTVIIELPKRPAAFMVTALLAFTTLLQVLVCRRALLDAMHGDVARQHATGEG
jgi:TRAP-type C4-dicarboxylate transport system permease small subunit